MVVFSLEVGGLKEVAELLILSAILIPFFALNLLGQYRQRKAQEQTSALLKELLGTIDQEILEEEPKESPAELVPFGNAEVRRGKIEVSRDSNPVWGEEELEEEEEAI